MNKNLKLVLFVVGCASFSASAPPGALGRMWAKLTCRSDCDAVKPVARSSRHDSGPAVEALTEVRNPYHVTREKISGAPGELRKQARGMRSGARMLDRVHEDAKEQHASDVARSHRGIRLDAGRMMMRTNGASQDAKKGAIALDKHVLQAQTFRFDARRKFRAQERRGRAWVKGAGVDENQTKS